MILKLYTQFPRCYPSGIVEMTDQLQDIAAMGFNAVWVNPLHLSGLKKVVRNKEEVSGSLYAMRSCDLFNPKFFGGEENNSDQARQDNARYRTLLKEYIKRAKSLGLVPIFDLVLGQIAAEDGNPTLETDPLLHLHKNDLVKDINPIDDIRKFQYAVKGKEAETKEMQDRVFKELWEPFIFEYIVDYGFMGARIDAVKWVPPYLLGKVCNYIQILCKYKNNGATAIILGELLDKQPLKYVEQLQKKSLTHVNNSVVHMPFTVKARRNDKNQEGWNASNYTLKEISELRQIGLPFGGGSVGYSGNHDELSLSLRVLKDNGLKVAPPPIDFMRLAREKLFGIVLSSDAGWYALAGDEFLIDRRSYMVFDNYNPPAFISGDHPIDLRGFITSINTLLSHLPTPEAFWVEHILSEELDPNHYSIAIRHTQLHNNRSDLISLVCAIIDSNLEPDFEALFRVLAGILQKHLARTENKVIPKTLFILDDQHLLEQSIATQEITHHREPIKIVTATSRM